MWIDYSAAIAESAAELAACERAARGRRAADRVKLLRLLKSGQERSLRRAAAVLAPAYAGGRGSGGGAPAARAAWRGCSRCGGRAGCARITRAALAGLAGEMRPFDKLRRAHCAAARGASLPARTRGHCLCLSLDGLSGLFQRRKIKRKTGRPRHRRAEAAAQAAFKKSVRGSA